MNGGQLPTNQLHWGALTIVCERERVSGWGRPILKVFKDEGIKELLAWEGGFYIGFTSVNIPMGAYMTVARVSFSVGTMHRCVSQWCNIAHHSSTFLLYIISSS